LNIYIRLHSPSGIVVIHNSLTFYLSASSHLLLILPHHLRWIGMVRLPLYFFLMDVLIDGRVPIEHFLYYTILSLLTYFMFLRRSLWEDLIYVIVVAVSLSGLRIPWTPIFLWQIIHTSAGICLLLGNYHYCA
jgi:hypothetical protein